ncbi:uncharacterized protein LOC118516619 isoform X3 [Anopheles stephensi]|uniref:uncharacterized protein LOC118516619 isoform X3 n=1 Tax=Anopheles stephensi TaxID=30069 RepID=UPI001658B1E3|nr:uncharacterized protein LOC118516619 isoform X3 [Anopheles stephensi]
MLQLDRVKTRQFYVKCDIGMYWCDGEDLTGTMPVHKQSIRQTELTYILFLFRKANLPAEKNIMTSKSSLYRKRRLILEEEERIMREERDAMEASSSVSVPASGASGFATEPASEPMNLGAIQEYVFTQSALHIAHRFPTARRRCVSNTGRRKIVCVSLNIGHRIGKSRESVSS